MAVVYFYDTFFISMLHRYKKTTKFLGKNSFGLVNLQMRTRNLQLGTNEKVHLQLVEDGP